jgi:hypothetical protein
MAVGTPAPVPVEAMGGGAKSVSLQKSKAVP